MFYHLNPYHPDSSSNENQILLLYLCSKLSDALPADSEQRPKCSNDRLRPSLMEPSGLLSHLFKTLLLVPQWPPRCYSNILPSTFSLQCSSHYSVWRKSIPSHPGQGLCQRQDSSSRLSDSKANFNHYTQPPGKIPLLQVSFTHHLTSVLTHWFLMKYLS